MGTQNMVDMGVAKRGKNAPGGYKAKAPKGESSVYNDLPGSKGTPAGNAKGLLGNRADPSRVGDLGAIEGFGGGSSTFMADDDSNFYNELSGGKGANNSGSGPGRAHAIDGFTSGGTLGGKV